MKYCLPNVISAVGTRMRQSIIVLISAQREVDVNMCIQKAGQALALATIVIGPLILFVWMNMLKYFMLYMRTVPIASKEKKWTDQY